MSTKTAADRIVQFLSRHGVRRAWCVPGESYIALLHALHPEQEEQIDLVVCRQEGGAAFSAMADAKLSGKPGVVLVSRGPGACNAAIGLHAAEQDAVPLILLIGQVEARDLRRRAFQEIDYHRMFGGVAKWVGEAHGPEEVPELIARAWSMAMQGVPGPVVLVLPEEVIAEPCAAEAPAWNPPLPSLPDVSPIAEALARAERPIILAGHGFEDVTGARQAALLAFAEAWQVPVAVSFRRQSLFPNDHPLYAGDLGLRNPDAQREAFAQADLVLALGTRLTDITTQGYSWPAPGQRLIHVCPDASWLNWRFAAEIAVAADAHALLAAMPAAPRPPAGRAAWNARLRALHVADCQVPARDWPDGLPFAEVAQLIGRVAAPDAIVSVDAGSFAAPFYRKVMWKPGQLLLPSQSGAMGCGMPGAVAAALRFPGRQVICAVGDGGLLMTGQELAVAQARGAAIKLIVSDNGSYGSIRIHQERAHPGAVSGTDLSNPDILGWCRAFGMPVLEVTTRADYAALEQGLAAPGPFAAVVRSSLKAILP
ncbi:pyruvate decarboxylase [Rhodovarius crocodyli]|uniref:Pyruvate decarboxylase n=1 Tax=Rhodovarius crocodyli TaxID=1979269 RepID=A0A437MFE6_9PROT|nr:thiamine pyrophosphate-binding protein [Rhodovarius crocodyli]RVT96345.1 pyruvate decarboxylase [Rhodovarius crocodyli]